MTKSRSFPTVSHDSDTPYQLTAKTLRILPKSQYASKAPQKRNWHNLNVNGSQHTDNSSYRNVISPESQDQTRPDKFEGYTEGNVEVVVPPNHETQRWINLAGGVLDEGSGNRHEAYHLGDTVIGHSDETGLKEVTEDETRRTAGS